MTNRREFLQATACAALPLAVGAGEKPAGPTTPMQSSDLIQAVLVDSAYPATMPFAAQLSGRGARIVSVSEGDLTTAWLAHIRPLWAQRPATIAGLTTPSTLFCLEQFAWSHGLRVVFHAEHIVAADGSLTHLFQRSAGIGLAAHQLVDAAGQWPVRLADAFITRRPPLRRQRPGPSIAALEPDLPRDARLLTSWIIATA